MVRDFTLHRFNGITDNFWVSDNMDDTVSEWKMDSEFIKEDRLDSLRYLQASFNAELNKGIIPTNKEPQVGGKRMAKFKVGDKVKCNSNSGRFYGKTGIVTDFDNSGINLRLDYNSENIYLYNKKVDIINSNYKPLTPRQQTSERLQGEIDKRKDIITKAQDEIKEMQTIRRRYKKFPTKEAEFAGLLGDLTNRKTSKKAIEALVQNYGMEVQEDKIKY